MEVDVETDAERRVLLVAPTSKDAELTESLLTGAGLICNVCGNLQDLCRELQFGASAVLLTEEAITDKAIDELLAILARQPSWSELPIIMLMRGGQQSPRATRVLDSLRNVTLLERPASMRSVVSAVRVAVKGRERQYQIRCLLEKERLARAEAERASHIKDEFLATLSHELRTPLNAILGWAQFIAGSSGDRATLDQGISVIERNARVQVQLIEDLLDMSRIISGKLTLDVKPINPASFIEAAIETVKPSANAKGIRLEKVVKPSVSLISGDPNRLQQVVWNLLSNAIKFTPRGGTVRVLVEPQDLYIAISVSDSGIGISREFLPHVFERFRQADASTTRAHGGLGLGLSIVKQLVELHGGTVSARSSGEGQGSTFEVLLPIATMPSEPRTNRKGAARVWEAQVADSEATSLEGMKILVVDDEPDTRDLIRRVLEQRKATVVTAGSAAEGLRLLEEEKPDLLLSDIGMPVMDGYDFLRQIRTLRSTLGGNVPAIALTAFARPEDRDRALQAGYLVHVAKPIAPQELIATVATVAGRIGEKSSH